MYIELVISIPEKTKMAMKDPIWNTSDGAIIPILVTDIYNCAFYYQFNLRLRISVLT